MQKSTRNILSFLLLLVTAVSRLPGAALAQNQPPSQQDSPRVLIIGDNIYRETARSVASELKDAANVVNGTWPPNTVANSKTALENLDQLLGRLDRNGSPLPTEQWPTWDLIHINVGLGDLVYRVPNMESFRVLPIHAGGVVATEPNQYEKNLDELIGKLKATGAKIVWANTTPIRHSRSNVFKVGSEVEYNLIADRVMKKHQVPINDMNGYARSVMNMDQPAGHGADPFDFDRKPIHGPIVEIIARELGLKRE